MLRTASKRGLSAPSHLNGNGAPEPSAPAKSLRTESYRLTADGLWIERSIALRNGGVARTRIAAGTVPRSYSSEDALAARFDQTLLCAAKWPRSARRRREIRVVDLFSGSGAMSLGIWEACRAVGARMVPVMALDFNQTALSVYAENFPGVWALPSAIETILDGELGAPASTAEHELIRRLGRVDVLVGGPPCQGHSDLNNHTRREDPKNRLYDRMARCAELLRPKHVVIENVPAVLHDKGRVVERTIAHLRLVGYTTDAGVVEAAEIGVPQRRRRHFVVASRERQHDISSMVGACTRPERSVAWAIGDLVNSTGSTLLDQSSTPSSANRARIQFLFAKRLYDLPDQMRPACHRLEAHSYKSVYGRLRPNMPAQTITSGFLSMGQGRYVHPSRRRTITPHEAARLQFIPDFFDFRSVVRRSALAEMVGNAVPPKLAYVIGLDLLR